MTKIMMVMLTVPVMVAMTMTTTVTMIRGDDNNDDNITMIMIRVPQSSVRKRKHPPQAKCKSTRLSQVPIVRLNQE